MADQERGRTGAPGPDNPEDGGHLADPPLIKADIRLIIASTVIWLAALALSGWDFYQRGLTVILPVTLVGLVMAIAGFVISRQAKQQLGSFFGPGLKIQPDHRIVKDGLYRRIRHPGTAADLLFDLGLPLIVSSFYGLVLMLLVIPTTLLRIRLEEQMLIEHFGHEYREYMRNTKKYIPGIY